MSPTAEPLPAISENTALLTAILFTLFYVAPFYISPTLRTSAITSRDAPAVIRARVRAVGLTCLACTVVAVFMLASYGHATPSIALRQFGIWPINPFDIFKVLMLVMILFTCSFYESLIVDGDWRDWDLSTFKEGIWDNWIGYRNLIVAPASEELVFRSLTIPLFLLARTSPMRIVFVTPLVFGLAHLHHLFAFLQSRTPSDQRFPPLGVWIHGIVASVFQFAYTSLFGFFAAFVFLRVGNLWAVIVAHCFCNWMGVPRLWGRVGQYHTPRQMQPLRSTASEKREDGASVASAGMGEPNGDANSEPAAVQTVSPAEENLGIVWSVAYYLLIFVGAYGFYKLLYPLTASVNALAKI